MFRLNLQAHGRAVCEMCSGRLPAPWLQAMSGAAARAVDTPAAQAARRRDTVAQAVLGMGDDDDGDSDGDGPGGRRRPTSPEEEGNDGDGAKAAHGGIVETDDGLQARINCLCPPAKYGDASVWG